jgi:hypothetical protein
MAEVLFLRRQLLLSGADPNRIERCVASAQTAFDAGDEIKEIVRQLQCNRPELFITRKA